MNQSQAGTTSPQLRASTGNPVETRRLGRVIGKQAEPGDVYLLVGDLGAGKTCLSQGIARGLGIKGYILSPSFVLVREYREGRLPLFHLDLYRLDNLAELRDLGLDDYFYGSGVTVVEWADKGLGLLPPGHLLIKIEIGEDSRRDFLFRATDAKHARVIERLKDWKIEKLKSPPLKKGD